MGHPTRFYKTNRNKELESQENDHLKRKEKKEKSMMDSYLASVTTCSFLEHLLDHYAANLSALHEMAWHHVCRLNEDAKVHS
jgi:hypothetical protein